MIGSYTLWGYAIVDKRGRPVTDAGPGVSRRPEDLWDTLNGLNDVDSGEDERAPCRIVPLVFWAPDRQIPVSGISAATPNVKAMRPHDAWVR